MEGKLHTHAHTHTHTHKERKREGRGEGVDWGRNLIRLYNLNFVWVDINIFLVTVEEIKYRMMIQNLPY
jgi:hypothetical protein